MTTDAVHLTARGIESAGMVSALLLNSFADFGMALQALKTALPKSEVVASGALGRSLQILVGLR